MSAVDVVLTATPGQTVYQSQTVIVEVSLEGPPGPSGSGGGGGGAVDSVNTQTGDVVLGASDVGAQPVDSDLTAIAALTTTSYGRAFLALADAAAARTALTLGTLATQSGTFSGTSSGTNTGDQTLPTTLPPNGAAGGGLGGTYPNPTVTVVAAGATGPLSATDTTTTNSRTPTAHAASHAPAGSDDLTTALSATSVPVALGTAALGSGTGFTRQGHVHPTTGLVLTSDSRLSDARTPTAHATTHKVGGTDAVRLDEFALPTASVVLNSQKITGLANGTAAQDAAAFGQIPLLPPNPLRPTAALYETFPRHVGGTNTLNGTSGTLYLAAIALPAGLVIGKLAFGSVGAVSGPTHWWFALFDSSRVMLAVTADQTTGAWAGNTVKLVSIATVASGASSSFTTTYTGLHYIGVMQTATTTATSFGCANVGAGANSDVPIICGTADAGMTTPPAFPFTATAITKNTGNPYAYVGT